MFTPLNLAVFVSFIVVTTLLANRLSGRAQSSRGFFQAGADGGLPWWAVALSIVATNTSTVTFLAVPTAVFVAGGNLTYAPMVIGFGLGVIAVALLFVRPLFNEQRAQTVFEFIGLRVHPAAGQFTLWLGYVTSLLNNSLRMLATGLVCSVATGLPLLPSLAAVTLLAAIWSAVAGIRTVIWADFIMYLVFTGGAVMSAVWIFAGLPFGLDEAWARLDAHGKLVLLDLSADPTKSFTLWTALFGASIMQLALASGQGTFQRIRSCRSVEDCRKAYLWSVAFSITPFLMLIIGLGLWLHYQVNPLPPEVLEQLAREPDRIFPHFIINELPDGVSGLIVTAILAAGISTLNSVFTEMADLTVNGVYRPLVRPSADDSHYLRVSRVTLLAWGAAFAGMAYWVSFHQADGLLQLAFKLPGYTAGIGLGTILLATLDRKTSLRRYAIAVSVSVATVTALALGDVNFWWWYLGGTATLLMVALPGSQPRKLVSRTGPRS